MPISRISHACKPIAHLAQWRVIRVAEGDCHLAGIVSGHPRLADGARIVTSRLVELAPDCTWAKTQNTLYRLGAPGEGPLPPEWAERIDLFLRWTWCTSRPEEDEL